MTSLILHIGRPRTGTTSIQQSLYHSRAFLRHHGILYPETGLHHGAHHQLGWGVSGQSITGWGKVPSFDSLLHKLANEVRSSKCENVIISTESLVHNIKDAGNLDKKQRLERLLALFSNVKVLCCARDQARIIESSYCFQTVWEHTQQKASFGDHVKNMTSLPGLNYSDIEDYYLDLDANVAFQFWSFSEAIASGNLVRRFFQVAGIEQAYRESVRVNESLSREATLAILEWNRAAKAGRRSRRSFVAWARATFPETGSSLYDVSLLADVIKTYKEANALLEKRTGIRFLDTPDPTAFASRCSGEKLLPHELDRVHARIKRADRWSLLRGRWGR